MTITADDRPIAILSTPNSVSRYTVGDSTGVDKILPYEENGECAPVTWFKIISNGVVVARVNGKYVDEILY